MDSIIKYIKKGDDLIIPDGVFFIPDKAFNRDHSFKRLIIGKDVSYIGRRAFSLCFGLKEVIFLPGSKCKELLSGCFMFCKNLSKINLPCSLRIIEERCFAFNFKLKWINIPPSVKKINNQVFLGSGIENITFNNNIDYVANDAFMGTQEIKNITLFGEIKNVELCEGYIVKFDKEPKLFQDVLIYKGHNICEYITDWQKDLWWKCTNSDGSLVSYGKNMKEAFKELKNKASNNIGDIAIENSWTLDTKVDVSQYSLMSGNCWHYTKIYMETFGYKPDDKLSIREILKISELQRNYSEFENFVNKYIIKDDGTRNGIKVNLKEESNKNE